MSYDVKAPVLRATLKRSTYKTKHIIDEVQEVLYTDRDDTYHYAKKFTATRSGMRQLYNEVFDRITYTEDQRGYQWVQTPSYLWHHTKVGDCKSLAVFISSVLQNMGVAHIIRYVSYDFQGYLDGRLTHVYVIAIINGEHIPMDITYGKQDGAAFGEEKPFAHKKDFYMRPGLYKLGSVNSELTIQEKQYLGDVEASLAEMELAMADVPDSIITAGGGDITQMTVGQLDRSIWMDRFLIYARQEANPIRRQKFAAAAAAMSNGSVAGIAGLDNDPLGKQVQQILSASARKGRPAFKQFNLVLGNAPDPAIAGLFRKVGNFFKKVGNKFKDLFKKFVNWIWKGPAKSMGPYFLFLFAKKGKVRSPEMKRRIAAQEKSFKFITKVGKFSESQLKGVMLNGIKSQTGSDTREIFSAAKTNHIGALGAVLAKVAGFVVKAIGWVIKVVQKIVSLFKGKRSDAGQIDEANSSDVRLLAEEARLQAEAEARRSGSNTPSGEEGGGSGKAILAALAVGVPLFLRAA